MNKATVYSEYGIKYQGGKIYNEKLGFVNPMLVDGNEKIGKGIFHFSTLPGTANYECSVNGIDFSVKGTCVCDCKGCYAMTGNYRYASVQTALGVRTWIARNDLAWIENAINAQIKADSVKFIRIHASGDFFGAEYIEMWKRIAIQNPDITLWTYTKNPAAENAFNEIPNCNIVKSVIPGKGVNFGHCDYILSCYEYLKAAGKSVYICRCGVDKGQHCTNCKGCSRNEYVLFIEHSTEYKAEKDSLFPVLKALIESQDSTIAGIQ